MEETLFRGNQDMGCKQAPKSVLCLPAALNMP